ncbi:MAG TPA: right-handed parallel beta-helix repeat-containing protein [Candidatus Bathyarchaeia archaeon]|nr:right-handed parallel beta-helix repeat-containing protein [Candidatus Bathyarchaeia archaeon]
MARKYTRREYLYFTGIGALGMLGAAWTIRNQISGVEQAVTQSLTSTSSAGGSSGGSDQNSTVTGMQTGMGTTNTNDAYLIVQAALAAGKTSIHLPAGNYIASQPITAQSVANVEIYGDGMDSTIITLNSNVLGHVIRLMSCDGFHVHDLQINGNKTNQAGGTSTDQYDYNGINAYMCNDGLIENCLILDCRNFGVELAGSPTNITVQNCLVQNSDANGINTNCNPGGGGNVIQNNTVDGFSDVGITLLGNSNYTCQGNVVKNGNLNNSPYSLNTHIGITGSEGINGSSVNPSGTTSHILNNTIQNCYASGAFYPGQGISLTGAGNLVFDVENNSITDCEHGIGINGVAGATVLNNTINGLGDKSGYAIKVEGASQNVNLQGNVIENLPAGLVSGGIVQLQGGQGQFINNTIQTNGNKKVIEVSPPVVGSWVITPNTIIASAPVPEFPVGLPILFLFALIICGQITRRTSRKTRI